MYNNILVSGVLQSNLTFACIHYEMVIMIILITICPQTKILQQYRFYSFRCILHPLAYLFYTWKFVPLNVLHLFHRPTLHLPHLWQPHVWSMMSLLLFCLVSFCFAFWILKSSHVSGVIQFFLCLTYFS